MDVLPGAIVAPSAKVGPDGGPGRKVTRQGTPLAPRAVQIQDRIDHFTNIDGSRTPAWLSGWDQWLQNGPFLILEITGVALGGQLAVRLRGRWLTALPRGNRVRSRELAHIRLSRTGLRIKLLPALPVQQTIDGAFVDLMSNLGFKCPLDLHYRCHLSSGGTRQERLEEGAFLFQRKV